jgi:Tfp pilus assembly protein PilV
MNDKSNSRQMIQPNILPAVKAKVNQNQQMSAQDMAMRMNSNTTSNADDGGIVFIEGSSVDNSQE